MGYLPPQGGSTVELFSGIVSSSDSLILGLVLALLVLVVASECPSPTRTRDARPDRSPFAGLHVRRAWQSSGPRRRARMAGRTGSRPTVPAAAGSVTIGRPSPAMRQLRARTAFRRASRDLAIARYPY